MLCRGNKRSVQHKTMNAARQVISTTLLPSVYCCSTLGRTKGDAAWRGTAKAHQPTSSSRPSDIIFTAPDTLRLRPWAENRCCDELDADAVANAASVARGLADCAAKLPPLKAMMPGWRREERSATDNNVGKSKIEIAIARASPKKQSHEAEMMRCCAQQRRFDFDNSVSARAVEFVETAW